MEMGKDGVLFVQNGVYHTAFMQRSHQGINKKYSREIFMTDVVLAKFQDFSLLHCDLISF